MIRPDHLADLDGSLSPQPWMQMRRVYTQTVDVLARRYGTTGGAAKNDLLQSISASWTNNSPVTQYVYGLVTQDGSRVTLQARSRGYLLTNHRAGMTSGTEWVPASRFGGGVDLGQGGLLGIGTGFGVHEVRSHSTTTMLMPQLTGWLPVKPGETVYAGVEVRFISEFWESQPIDGGEPNTESSVQAGELRLDLFAIPVFGDAPPRKIPTIVATTTGIEISKSVTVAKPAGTQVGDMLLAIVVNQFGPADAITAPAGWTRLHTVNDGLLGLNSSHMRIWVREATSKEPASYTFGNAFLAEEIVHLMAIRDAEPVGPTTEALTWSVASSQKRWSKNGDLHVAPSIPRKGQLLICASFCGLTDYPWDLNLGPVPITQTPPVGMTETVDKCGTSATMSVAYLKDPPSPTEPRTFVPKPRAFFSNYAICASILVPGAVQL